jgi:hypothetical protein
MTITILASIFLALILLIAFIGFKVATQQTGPMEDPNTEKCSLCRTRFHRSVLIERQVGDHKLFFFCPACVRSLHEELVTRN